MTENQLIKLKNRLLNIQTQLQGGTLVLGGSVTEQNIKARLETAIKKVKECYELTVGMDMCYCSKNCAYATNNVCSLKG